MRNEYRLLQDGMVVAASTGLSDILHYAAVYGQDGPVTVQHLVKGKWRDMPLPPAPTVLESE